MTESIIIPSQVAEKVLAECGNRCAACGAPTSQETAQFLFWGTGKEKKAENLVSLCANCHDRVHQEHWSERVLREYKISPWVMRTVQTWHGHAMQRFELLQLHHWRQFNDVHILLDSRMTVLTGENGTGKTTILNVLSRHFGWNLTLISTPLPLSKQHSSRIWSDAWDMLKSDWTKEPGSIEVGKIRYGEDKECALMAPPQLQNALYSLTYQNQQNVLGLHIPSHGPLFAYHRVDSIPTDPKSNQQQYQQYQNLLQQLYNTGSAQNPGRTLKSSLISLAVFGYGNQAVAPNPEYQHMFERFQDILAILLPSTLGFERLEIRMPDIVFRTRTGDFSLDAASGGIGALVGIAWQVFMYGADKEYFVVTIDEPESHLHPSMQRELLPNLFRAFPKTQFIVATHSPFIATSLAEARVYALVYNDERRVNSVFLDTADLSGSANEVLREILGVPLSVPIWVEQRLAALMRKYSGIAMTRDILDSLKRDLIANDLGELLPEAIQRLRGTDA